MDRSGWADPRAVQQECEVMVPRWIIAGVLGAIVGTVSAPTIGDEVPLARTYPAAPTSDTVDDYHGVKVADPYRPLEDPDSPATRAWVEAENGVTRDYLNSIPERTSIKRRLTELWDYEKYDPPVREGDRYFFTFNTGLQNQKVLYTCDSLDGESRVLLDPNTLSSDGTLALAGLDVSEDGRY